MTARRPLVVPMALAAGALTAAGCGGSDKPKSLADAKAALSKDCQQGKASDKPLCDCIADELQAAGKTAQQISDITDKVNGGEEPAEITKAAGTCGAKLAGGGG